MEGILVSVIIPVFNTEKYLRECLDSVLMQTHSNIEVICINDASTDNSMEILADYKRKDSRIYIIDNHKTLGPSSARNKGIDAARGKYILFVDSDDYIARNLLEETVKCAEKNNLEELHYNFKIITDKEWRWQTSNKVIMDEAYHKYKSGLDMLVESKKTNSKYKSVETVWSCIFNREYLRNNNLRFYEGILHEDCLFYFKRCICAERVGKLNKTYYFYRKREDSITTGVRNIRRKSLFTVISEIYAVWLHSQFDSDVQKAIEAEMKFYWIKYKQSQLSGEKLGSQISVNPTIDFMYQLTNSDVIDNADLLRQRDIDYLQDRKEFILYGCGEVATEVILYLNKLGLQPTYIMVEFHKGNPVSFAGVEVHTIEELNGLLDIPVIIGVSKRYSEEITRKLGQIGYNHIIGINRN